MLWVSCILIVLYGTKPRGFIGTIGKKPFPREQRQVVDRSSSNFSIRFFTQMRTTHMDDFALKSANNTKLDNMSGVFDSIESPFPALTTRPALLDQHCKKATSLHSYYQTSPAWSAPQVSTLANTARKPPPPPHTTAQPSLTNVARKPPPSLHVTKPASCDGFVSGMWLLTVCCFMPVALKIFSSFMTVSDAKSCTASQSRLLGLPPMAKCLDPFSTFSPRSGQIKDMTACQGYRVWHISDTSHLRASFPGETILFSNGRPATQLGLCHLPRSISILILV